jgi:hypothetical protein
VNREPTLDDVIGEETSGAERQRLQHVHDLLLQAGPPPELSPGLEAGPTLGMTFAKERRATKPRALLLLAAALCLALVFFAGYAASNHGSGTGRSTQRSVELLALKGTPLAPHAQGTLQVWHASDGNWPMTLRVAGLPQDTNYEVYLVRNGRPWGSCGTFRVESSRDTAVVTLNAPYSLKPGDSWVVLRAGHGGTEPGQTVLKPVTA